jgi:hypothetical protein
MSKVRIIQPGFSKAVNFVIKSVSIVREPTTFGSKSLSIVIRISKSLGFKTIVWRDEGYRRAPD